MSLPEFANFDNLNSLLGLEVERRIRDQRKYIQSIIAEHFQKYSDAKTEYTRSYEVLCNVSTISLEREAINEAIKDIDAKTAELKQLDAEISEIQDRLSQLRPYESIDPESLEQAKQALSKCDKDYNSEMLKECFEHTIALKEAEARCSTSLASIQKRAKGAARAHLRRMVDVMDSDSD